MPRPRNQVPTYRLHKQSGQAIITISVDGTRRDMLLGKYGSPESKTEYRRILDQLATAGPKSVTTNHAAPHLSVNELLLAFLKHADTHYRHPDGTPTGEVKSLAQSIRPVRKLFGTIPAAEFSPKCLKAVRQSMIDGDLARGVINRRIDRVRRVFKWGVSEELLPIAVYEALRTVSGLRAGRSAA
jgi:hypothetical protein